MADTRVVYDDKFNQVLLQGQGLADIDQSTAEDIEATLQESTSWINDAWVDNDHFDQVIVNLATTAEFSELSQEDRSTRFVSAIDRILEQLNMSRGKVSLIFSSIKLSRLPIREY